MTSYPSLQPHLESLSVSSCPKKTYCRVHVFGALFFPASSSVTNTVVAWINAASQEVQYLPVTFYSSSELSFLVPLNAAPNMYTVRVANLIDNPFNRKSKLAYKPEWIYSEHGLSFSVF